MVFQQRNIHPLLLLLLKNATDLVRLRPALYQVGNKIRIWHETNHELLYTGVKPPPNLLMKREPKPITHTHGLCLPILLNLQVWKRNRPP